MEAQQDFSVSVRIMLFAERSYLQNRRIRMTAVTIIGNTCQKKPRQMAGKTATVNDGCYLTVMFRASGFLASAFLGITRRSTPFSYFASIFSLSTSSGIVKVRLNEE